jgi:hypothetical protein
VQSQIAFFAWNVYGHFVLDLFTMYHVTPFMMSGFYITYLLSIYFRFGKTSAKSSPTRFDEASPVQVRSVCARAHAVHCRQPRSRTRSRSAILTDAVARSRSDTHGQQQYLSSIHHTCRNFSTLPQSRMLTSYGFKRVTSVNLKYLSNIYIHVCNNKQPRLSEGFDWYPRLDPRTLAGGQCLHSHRT